VSSEENVGFAELIRDLLLAMVEAQNEANKSYLSAIDDLVSYRDSSGC
jgi:hypothetical protein